MARRPRARQCVQVKPTETRGRLQPPGPWGGPPRSVIVDLPKLSTAPGPRFQIAKQFAITQGVDHPPCRTEIDRNERLRIGKARATTAGLRRRESAGHERGQMADASDVLVRCHGECGVYGVVGDDRRRRLAHFRLSGLARPARQRGTRGAHL